jgi:hypothetical protein
MVESATRQVLPTATGSPQGRRLRYVRLTAETQPLRTGDAKRRVVAVVLRPIICGSLRRRPPEMESLVARAIRNRPGRPSAHALARDSEGSPASEALRKRNIEVAPLGQLQECSRRRWP